MHARCRAQGANHHNPGRSRIGRTSSRPYGGVSAATDFFSVEVSTWRSRRRPHLIEIFKWPGSIGTKASIAPLLIRLTGGSERALKFQALLRTARTGVPEV